MASLKPDETAKSEANEAEREPVFQSPAHVGFGLKRDDSFLQQKDEDTMASLDLFIETLHADAERDKVVVPPSPFHVSGESGMDIYGDLDMSVMEPPPSPAPSAASATLTTAAKPTQLADVEKGDNSEKCDPCGQSQHAGDSHSTQEGAKSRSSADKRSRRNNEKARPSSSRSRERNQKHSRGRRGSDRSYSAKEPYSYSSRSSSVSRSISYSRSNQRPSSSRSYSANKSFLNRSSHSRRNSLSSRSSHSLKNCNSAKRWHSPSERTSSRRYDSRSRSPSSNDSHSQHGSRSRERDEDGSHSIGSRQSNRSSQSKYNLHSTKNLHSSNSGSSSTKHSQVVNNSQSAKSLQPVSTSQSANVSQSANISQSINNSQWTSSSQPASDIQSTSSMHPGSGVVSASNIQSGGSVKSGGSSDDYWRLLEKYRILRSNMLSLCHTAQREMQRKQTTIDQLRKEFESLRFKSGKIGTLPSTCSPIHSPKTLSHAHVQTDLSKFMAGDGLHGLSKTSPASGNACSVFTQTRLVNLTESSTQYRVAKFAQSSTQCHVVSFTQSSSQSSAVSFADSSTQCRAVAVRSKSVQARVLPGGVTKPTQTDPTSGLDKPRTAACVNKPSQTKRVSVACTSTETVQCHLNSSITQTDVTPLISSEVQTTADPGTNIAIQCDGCELGLGLYQSNLLQSSEIHPTVSLSTLKKNSKESCPTDLTESCQTEEVESLLRDPVESHQTDILELCRRVSGEIHNAYNVNSSAVKSPPTKDLTEAPHVTPDAWQAKDLSAAHDRAHSSTTENTQRSLPHHAQAAGRKRPLTSSPVSNSGMSKRACYFGTINSTMSRSHTGESTALNEARNRDGAVEVCHSISQSHSTALDKVRNRDGAGEVCHSDPKPHSIALDKVRNVRDRDRAGKVCPSNSQSYSTALDKVRNVRDRDVAVEVCPSNKQSTPMAFSEVQHINRPVNISSTHSHSNTSARVHEQTAKVGVVMNIENTQHHDEDSGLLIETHDFDQPLTDSDEEEEFDEDTELGEPLLHKDNDNMDHNIAATGTGDQNSVSKINSSATTGTVRCVVPRKYKSVGKKISPRSDSDVSDSERDVSELSHVSDVECGHMASPTGPDGKVVGRLQDVKGDKWKRKLLLWPLYVHRVTSWRKEVDAVFFNKQAPKVYDWSKTSSNHSTDPHCNKTPPSLATDSHWNKTSSIHSTDPHWNKTPPSHSTDPHCIKTPPTHATDLYCNKTSSSHSTDPHCNKTPPSHSTDPHWNKTPPSHATDPHWNKTSSSHSTDPHWNKTPPSHSTDPHWNKTPPSHATDPHWNKTMSSHSSDPLLQSSGPGQSHSSQGQSLDTGRRKPDLTQEKAPEVRRESEPEICVPPEATSVTAGTPVSVCGKPETQCSDLMSETKTDAGPSHKDKSKKKKKKNKEKRKNKCAAKKEEKKQKKKKKGTSVTPLNEVERDQQQECGNVDSQRVMNKQERADTVEGNMKETAQEMVTGDQTSLPSNIHRLGSVTEVFQKQQEMKSVITKEDYKQGSQNSNKPNENRDIGCDEESDFSIHTDDSDSEELPLIKASPNTCQQQSSIHPVVSNHQNRNVDHDPSQVKPDGNDSEFGHKKISKDNVNEVNEDAVDVFEDDNENIILKAKGSLSRRKDQRSIQQPESPQRHHGLVPNARVMSTGTESDSDMNDTGVPFRHDCPTNNEALDTEKHITEKYEKEVRGKSFSKFPPSNLNQQSGLNPAVSASVVGTSQSHGESRFALNHIAGVKNQAHIIPTCKTDLPHIEDVSGSTELAVEGGAPGGRDMDVFDTPVTPVACRHTPVTPKKQWLLRTKSSAQCELFTGDASKPSVIWSPDKTTFNVVSHRQPMNQDTFHDLLGLSKNSSTSCEDISMSCVDGLIKETSSCAQELPADGFFGSRLAGQATKEATGRLTTGTCLKKQANSFQGLIPNIDSSDKQCDGQTDQHGGLTSNESEQKRKQVQGLHSENIVNLEVDQTKPVQLPSQSDDNKPLFSYSSSVTRENSKNNFQLKCRRIYLPPSSSSSATSVTASKSSSATSTSSSLSTEPPHSLQRLGAASHRLSSVEEETEPAADVAAKESDRPAPGSPVQSSQGWNPVSSHGLQCPPDGKDAHQSIDSVGGHSCSTKQTENQTSLAVKGSEEEKLEFSQNTPLEIEDCKHSDLNETTKTRVTKFKELEEGEIDSMDTFSRSSPHLVSPADTRQTSSVLNITEQSLEEGEIQSSDECDMVAHKMVSSEPDAPVNQLSAFSDHHTTHDRHRLPHTSDDHPHSYNRGRTSDKVVKSVVVQKRQVTKDKCSEGASSKKRRLSSSGGCDDVDKETEAANKATQQQRQQSREHLDNIRRRIVGQQTLKGKKRAERDLKSFTIPKLTQQSRETRASRARPTSRQASVDCKRREDDADHSRSKTRDERRSRHSDSERRHSRDTEKRHSDTSHRDHASKGSHDRSDPDNHSRGSTSRSSRARKTSHSESRDDDRRDHRHKADSGSDRKRRRNTPRSPSNRDSASKKKSPSSRVKPCSVDTLHHSGSLTAGVGSTSDRSASLSVSPSARKELSFSGTNSASAASHDHKTKSSKTCETITNKSQCKSKNNNADGESALSASQKETDIHVKGVSCVDNVTSEELSSPEDVEIDCDGVSDYASDFDDSVDSDSSDIEPDLGGSIRTRGFLYYRDPVKDRPELEIDLDEEENDNDKEDKSDDDDDDETDDDSNESDEETEESTDNDDDDDDDDDDKEPHTSPFAGDSAYNEHEKENYTQDKQDKQTSRRKNSAMENSDKEISNKAMDNLERAVSAEKGYTRENSVDTDQVSGHNHNILKVFGKERTGSPRTGDRDFKSPSNMSQIPVSPKFHPTLDSLEDCLSIDAADEVDTFLL